MNITEPLITINKHTLTYSQSMTVRVAIENFAMDLNSGDKGFIEEAYLNRIEEIRRYLYDDAEDAINKLRGK